MNLFLKCFGLFLFLSISLQAGKIDVYVPMKGEPVLVPDDELGVLDVDFTALVERHIDRSAARRSGLLRRRLEVRMFPGAGGPSTWEMGTVMEVTREGGTVILLDNGETVHRGYEFFFPAGGCPNFRFSDEVSVEISFHVALHELGARWLQNETDDGDEVA